MTITAVAGKAGLFKFNAVDLSTWTTKVDFDESAMMLDTTTFGATAKSFIGGLKDNKFSADFIYDQSANASEATLQPQIGNLVTFEYGPAGSTTGNTKYTGSLLLQDLKLNEPVAGLETMTAAFQVSGAVTKGVY